MQRTCWAVRRLPRAVGPSGHRTLASLLLATVVVLGVGPSAVQASAGLPRTTRYQFGIDTYFPFSCQRIADIEQWATTEVSQFAALHANSIGITFPIYDNFLTSNVVYAKLVCGNAAFRSPPPYVLADVVRIAHAAGLGVLLRPSFDQSRFGPFGWSGVVAPSDRTAWFHSYLATLKPYLKMAQSTHVEHFAIESEMNRLAAASNWNGAIRQASHWYKGDLEWNYSWFTPVHKITPEWHVVQHRCVPPAVRDDAVHLGPAS